MSRVQGPLAQFCSSLNRQQLHLRGRVPFFGIKEGAFNDGGVNRAASSGDLYLIANHACIHTDHSQSNILSQPRRIHRW